MNNKLELPENHIAMIRQKVIEMNDYGSFVTVSEIRNIVRYRNAEQYFAIDDYFSYDVTPFGGSGFDPDNENAFMWWQPVIYPAVYVYHPDEGRSGILTWLYSKGHHEVRDGLRLSWPSPRWIYTRELKMSPDEIRNNIIDEILAGENVFTQKPPGWV